MNINRINSQKGIAQFLVIAVMAFLALGIPTATKLVQENQDNRGKATENEIIPAAGITMDLENPVYMGVGETLMMKYHLIPANSTDKATWSVTKGSDAVTVDANGLVKALKPGEADILGLTTDRAFTIQNVVVTGKDVGQVDIFYIFREGNDYRVLTPGMDIVSELKLNTFGQVLSSAEIVYYHTEALDPYLDGVTGTELVKVVSHKKDGAWNSLKVEFDKSKKPADSVYVLKIKTKVVKSINNANLEVYKGLSLSGSNGEIGKTEILNTDGKRMNIGQVSGTNFGISGLVNQTPTPSPKPISVNGVCGTVKYSQLSKNSPNDKNLVLCKSGKISEFGMAITAKCACPPNISDCKCPDNLADYYAWKCLGSNGGSDIQCNVANTNERITPTPTKTVSKIDGKCGTANGKTFEATPVHNLCEIGSPSIYHFNTDYHLYYWRCGDVKKPENKDTFCQAIVNGLPGSSKIIFNSKHISVGIGTSVQIDYRMEPKNSKDTIIWSSNMPDFFTVDSRGVVKTINEGASGHIIAMTSSGQGASIEVDTSSYTTKINGKCSSSLNKCLSGTFKDLPDSTTLLVWQCSGSNGGKSVKCSIKNNLTSGNGVCGDTTKIITNTCVSGSLVDLPDTVGEYVWQCKGTKKTELCVKIKGSDDDLCPKNQFNHWGKCEKDLEIGWGCDRDGVCISGKCDLSTNRCVDQNTKIPATSIRISPLGLSLKVGQNRNLTYVLSPASSTDTVKWSTSAESMVRIQKITLKCADSPNAKCIDAPGINHLQVTGLKAGTVKIKLTTSSGKTAQATVVINK